MDENPLNPAPEKPEETARLLPLNRRARRALIASERRQMGLRKPFGTQFWFPRGRKPTQKDPNAYMKESNMNYPPCTCEDRYATRHEDNPTGHYVGCARWGTPLPCEPPDTSPEESDVTADVREEPDGE